MIVLNTRFGRQNTVILLYCDARGMDETKAILPARSKQPGSATAVSLLYVAVRRIGMSALPHIEKDNNGKPAFPDFPEVYFSLSHSRGHVLCALGSSPVGCDIECRRVLVKGTEEKLMSQSEKKDFDFFELWTLRESFYKLTGRGSLRDIRFSVKNGFPKAPEEGVFCRSYREVEGVLAAVCSYEKEVPEKLEFVDANRIFSS